MHREPTVERRKEIEVNKAVTRTTHLDVVDVDRLHGRLELLVCVFHDRNGFGGAADVLRREARLLRGIRSRSANQGLKNHTGQQCRKTSFFRRFHVTLARSCT